MPANISDQSPKTLLRNKKIIQIRTRLLIVHKAISRRNNMGKIKQLVEDLKRKENLTTQEILTKFPDLAKLLEQEEKEELNESQSKRVLLKG